jgi:hypothetical protein
MGNILFVRAHPTPTIAQYTGQYLRVHICRFVTYSTTGADASTCVQTVAAETLPDAAATSYKENASSMENTRHMVTIDVSSIPPPPAAPQPLQQLRAWAS